MKKYLIVSVVIMAIFSYAALVSADTVFNDMSKCVQDIGKQSTSSSSSAPATMMAKPAKTVDVLGNMVPTQTDNSGKITLVK